MPKLDINVGQKANDGTGDDLRTAMEKINTNFTELYGTTAEANDLIEDISPQLGGNLDVNGKSIVSVGNGNINIIPNGTGILTLGSITLEGSKISANDSTRIRIAEGLDVSGSVILDGNLKLAEGTTVNEFTVSISADSTAVSHSKVPTQKAVYDFVNEVVVSASSIIMVGDDSTGTAVTLGESFQIAGAQNITTAVSGHTLTVTGPDLSSYATTSYVTSQGYVTASSSNALSNKTGNISQWTNDSVYITDINLNIVADDSATISINNNGVLLFSGGNGISTSTSSDGSVTISRNTISNVFNIGADDSTIQSISEGGTLVIEGGTGLATSLSGNTLTVTLTSGGGVGSVGDLTVSGQQIIGTQSNSDITVTPNGVGQINLESHVIKVGDLDSDVTVSSNGTGNLILTTNIENPSVNFGSITVEDGVNGKINIKSGEHGYVHVGNAEWSDLSSSAGNRNHHGFTSVQQYTRNLSDYNLERYHANSIGARVNLLGVDPDNGLITGYKAQNIELYNSLLSKSLSSKGWYTFDPSSKNIGIESGESGGQARSYIAGPTTLGVANYFRNGSNGPAYVEETAGISSFTGIFHDSSASPISFGNIHGVQQAFNLSGSGGTTSVDNIRAFLATGNIVTDGTVTTANNYYAFYAQGLSEATNNWGIYVESADWENYLGGLTIVDSTIRADRSDENLYLETVGAGKVIINSTLNVSNLEVNTLSSADSSAIQLNTGLNVSGTLSANVIDTNTISSVDSSAVTINDNLDVSGTLLVNTISSADSSAIQLIDDVNISGVLTVAGNFVVSNFITNTISSDDSSAVTINDNLDVSGTLLVNTISSADSSAIQLNTGLNVSGTLSVDTLDANVISSNDSTSVTINDSLNVTDNINVGGMLTLANRTVAQLNLLTPLTGSISYCTNEGTGAQPVYYDGTNWRTIRVGDVVSV